MASPRIACFVAVVAVLCALAAATPDYVSMFEDFKKAYGKAYATPAEDALRLRSFIANMKKAETAQLTNPHARFGVNGLSDLTEEEWAMRRGDAKYFQNVVKNRAGIDVFRFPQRDVDALKTTQSAARLDWRARGAVTPIKNQEKCGGCWAFSTTGNIEGQWFLAGNTLTSLSEQQLLSCDTTCNGCHGGLMDSAFAWLIQNRNGVIDTEASYPFVSGMGSVPQCTSGHTGGAQISGYRDIAHDEDQMAAYTYQHGPISIGVDSHTFQTYQSGIVTDCVSIQMDHAVLIVGYDDTHNPPYWIVKNQWGTSWGEDGYIRLEKGTNQCLITGAPSSSYVTNSGSSSGSAGSSSTAGSGSGAAPSGSGSGPAPSGSGSSGSSSGSGSSGSGSFPF